MDPITHAVVGLALGISGSNNSALSEGLILASTLGAVAPDLDIVAQFWGDYAYLKQHRGFSHSLPGLGLIGLITAAILVLFYPQAGFINLAIWAFIGALSHSLLDFFNSYGVKLFWPFSNKKWSASIIAIFDPFIFTISLIIIFSGGRVFQPVIAGLLFLVYLFIRLVMRFWAQHMVARRLKCKFPQLKVAVLPSMHHFFKWDFIAMVPGRNIIGSVNLLRRRFRIIRRLYCAKDKMEGIMSETIIGKLFQEFTPFFHINCEQVEDKVIGHFMDLRYHVKGRFLHNGTIVMSQDLEVEEAVFQPFNMSRRVYMTE